MSVYGVDVSLFDSNGISYREFGLGEYEGPDAFRKAHDYAFQRVGLHPDAAACILRDGDPFAWVNRGNAGDAPEPAVRYIASAQPDYF